MNCYNPFLSTKTVKNGNMLDIMRISDAIYKDLLNRRLNLDLHDVINMLS